MQSRLEKIKLKTGNTLPITPKAHGFINETIYTTWFMPPEVFPSTLPIPPLLLLRGLGHTGATLWKERLTWLLPIIRESLILKEIPISSTTTRLYRVAKALSVR